MSTRQTLVVKGRQNSRVTVIVEVHRGKVWVITDDSPFNAEAIFEPGQVQQFMEMLGSAAREAKEDKDRTRRSAP